MNLPKQIRLSLFGVALGVASSLLFSSPLPAQTARVLLIAVPEYDNAGSENLPSTRNDVMQLAQTFRERNENVQVRVLGAEKGSRPTRLNIGNEINNWLVKGSKKEDTLIFFFTGHGFVDPKEPSKTYLVSCDCDPKNPEKTGVPIDGLRKLLEKSPAQNKFMIIDACHSGANPFGIDPLKQFVNHAGVITLASAKFGEKSLVWEEQGMSLFSYWLNEGLKGHADENKNGFVSFDELYQYVYKNVPLCSKRISSNETQTPVRIIGPDVAGTPEFAQLKPTSLDQLLNDIVEQVSMQLRFNRINRTGVLNFTIEAHGNFLETPEEYELIKLYCASQVKQRLKERFKNNESYDFIEPQLTQEAILKSVDVTAAPNQQAKPEKPRDQPLEIQGKKIGALLKGNVLGRQTHRFSMRCTLVHPNDGKMLTGTGAGGTAILTPDEWMMFGGSVDFVPQIRQALYNQDTNVDMTPVNVNVESNEPAASQSLTHLLAGLLLNVPQESPELLIEKLDKLSQQTHPLLNQEFPFRIEIYVKSQSESESYSQKRSPISVGNQVYFPLEEGEVYQIRISADQKLLPKFDSVGVKVLVDGLNTFPEAEYVEQENFNGLQYIQAQRVLLGKATPWAMPLDRPLKINGFYTIPTSVNRKARYNEFQVTKQEDAHAIQQGETDMKQIGLISVVFYMDMMPKIRVGAIPRGGGPISTNSSGHLGTKLGTRIGEQSLSEIEVRACENIGAQLAVVHLRYDSRKKIEERLENFHNEVQNPRPAAP